jgi:hypothetical protein
MRRSIFIVSVILVAGLADAGETPYKGPTDVTQYLFCTALQSQREMPDESIRPGAVYYSGAFVLMGQSVRPATDGFLAYLDKTYGFKPDPNDTMPVTCTGVHSLDEARSVEKLRLEQSKKGGGKVVETGWTPASP